MPFQIPVNSTNTGKSHVNRCVIWRKCQRSSRHHCRKRLLASKRLCAIAEIVGICKVYTNYKPSKLHTGTSICEFLRPTISNCCKHQIGTLHSENQSSVKSQHPVYSSSSVYNIIPVTEQCSWPNQYSKRS